MMTLIMTPIGTGKKMMKTTTKIKVPRENFKQVEDALKKSGVKFYPFTKFYNSYIIKFEPADHPLVTYLTLTYDVTVI